MRNGQTCFTLSMRHKRCHCCLSALPSHTGDLPYSRPVQFKFSMCRRRLNVIARLRTRFLQIDSGALVQAPVPTARNALTVTRQELQGGLLSGCCMYDSQPVCHRGGLRAHAWSSRRLASSRPFIVPTVHQPRGSTGGSGRAAAAVSPFNVGE